MISSTLLFECRTRSGSDSVTDRPPEAFQDSTRAAAFLTSALDNSRPLIAER